MSAGPVNTEEKTPTESDEQAMRGTPVAKTVGGQVMPVQDGEEAPREVGEATPGPGQAADGEGLGDDLFGEDDLE